MPKSKTFKDQKLSRNHERTKRERLLGRRLTGSTRFILELRKRLFNLKVDGLRGNNEPVHYFLKALYHFSILQGRIELPQRGNVKQSYRLLFDSSTFGPFDRFLVFSVN